MATSARLTSLAPPCFCLLPSDSRKKKSNSKTEAEMGIFRNINSQKEKGEGRKRWRRGHFLLTLLARRPIITPPLSGSGRPLIDRWRDRWRAPGCVKDSCDVKMELPSSCEVPAFTLACFLTENSIAGQMFRQTLLILLHVIFSSPLRALQSGS